MSTHPCELRSWYHTQRSNSIPRQSFEFIVDSAGARNPAQRIVAQRSARSPLVRCKPGALLFPILPLFLGLVLLPKCSLLRDCNYHYAETNPRPDGSGIRNGCVSASARRTNHRLSRASSRVVRSLTCGHELFRSDNRKFTFTLCTAVPLYHRITPAPHQIATCSSCRTAQSVPPAPELLV